MSIVNITIKTTHLGEVFWESILPVNEGSIITVNTDKALATIRAERDKLLEFVELCSRKGGVMVSGNRLSIAANNVLGRGAVVTDAEPENEGEGGV